MYIPCAHVIRHIWDKNRNTALPGLFAFYFLSFVHYSCCTEYKVFYIYSKTHDYTWCFLCLDDTRLFIFPEVKLSTDNNNFPVSELSFLPAPCRCGLCGLCFKLFNHTRLYSARLYKCL